MNKKDSISFRIFWVFRDTIAASIFLIVGIVIGAISWPGIHFLWAVLFLACGIVLVLRINISPFQYKQFSKIFEIYFPFFSKKNIKEIKPITYYRAAIIFFVFSIFMVPVFSIFYSAESGLSGVGAALFILSLVGMYNICIAIFIRYIR